jgi:hypothetical protein
MDKLELTEKSKLLARTIEGALTDLRDSPFWMELFRQNISCASPEGFLQSSLLGAVNRIGGNRNGLWCDRERKTCTENGGYFKPDLWFVIDSNTDWAEWRQLAGAEKLMRTQGLVETKVAWAEGWATGSAVLSSKLMQIEDDLNKFHKIDGLPSTCPCLELVLLVGGCVEDARNKAIAAEENATVRLRKAHASLSEKFSAKEGYNCIPLRWDLLEAFAPVQRLKGSEAEYVGAEVFLIEHT